MAKNKIPKEDLKSPDAFLSTADRVSQVLSEYAQPIVATLVAILLVGGGWLGYNQWDNYRERKAGEELFAIKAALDKKQEEVRSASLPNLDKDNLDFMNLPTVKGDFDQDFRPLVSRFEQAISSHHGRRVTVAASLELAAFLVEHERFERAAEVLKGTEARMSRRGLLAPLLWMQLASIQSHLDNWDEVIRLYNKVLENPQATSVHADTLLKLGVAFEKIGEWDMARNMYTRASTDYGDSDAGRRARSYLRLLDIKKTEAPHDNEGEAGNS